MPPPMQYPWISAMEGRGLFFSLSTEVRRADS